MKFTNIFDREVFVKELDNEYTLHIWRSVGGVVDPYGIEYTACLSDRNADHDVFVTITKRVFRQDDPRTEEEQIEAVGKTVEKYMPIAKDKFDAITALLDEAKFPPCDEEYINDYTKGFWEEGIFDRHIKQLADK